MELRVRGSRAALALIAVALAGTAWAVRSASNTALGMGALELAPPRPAEGAVAFRTDVWSLPDD
jgi:hypothetical protein